MTYFNTIAHPCKIYSTPVYFYSTL